MLRIHKLSFTEILIFGIIYLFVKLGIRQKNKKKKIVQGDSRITDDIQEDFPTYGKKKAQFIRFLSVISQANTLFEYTRLSQVVTKL